LGIGHWPQAPIPNPQSPIPKFILEIFLKYFELFFGKSFLFNIKMVILLKENLNKK
jgi:hypothetical protein